MSDKNLTERINKLHQPGLVDMHFDMLMDLYEKRHRSQVMTTDYLPEFEAGGIGVVAANIFLMDHYLPELGLRIALDQVARLYIELEQTDKFVVCRTYNDILQARQNDQIAIIIAMEGVEPLGRDIDLLRIFYELGLRELSLTHARRNWAGSGGVFASSGSSKDGLTAFGKEVVRQCESWGIIVDLAHINAAGFDDALSITTHPIIVSHTNPRHFYNIERNISDEQIKQVGERGGVVGVGAALLSSNSAEMTLDNYADQIEHVVELAGIDGVGLGFDFFESIFRALPDNIKRDLHLALPEIITIPELVNHAHARNLTRKLIERGFSDEALQKILYGNFMRIFGELL